MPLPLDYVGPNTWYSDETLFSLCSRIHRATSHAQAADTCRMLFGHARLGAAHDLPCRVSVFAERFGGMFGSAEQIIFDHTLLPFFLPFQSPDLACDAIRTMSGPRLGGLKYRLGLLTSRFRANHPLRACPACIREDRDAHGRSYWHRDHQWPGVWTCRRHGIALLIADEKSNGIERFSFLLPEDARLRAFTAPEAEGAITKSATRAAASLTNAACSLAHTPAGTHFEPQTLLATYLDALASRGGAWRGGRLDHAFIGEGIAALAKPLRQLPVLNALPGTPREAVAQFTRLLRTPRTGTHPLRHLVLIMWLFGDWQAFQNAYDRAARSNRTERSGPVLDEGPAKNDRLSREGRRFITRLQKGQAVRAAAAATGISTQTGLEWAAQAGISIKRRPKQLHDSDRERIVQELQRGEDINALASRHGVSYSTISRILRSVPGLKETWLTARFVAQRDQMRSRWRKLTEQHPHIGVKARRMMQPAVYAWLYRHDVAWLADLNRETAATTTGNHCQVDWVERDRTLANAVRRAALAIYEHDPDVPIALWQLCRDVPDLYPKLKRLDRMPLTAQALDQVVGRRLRRTSLL